MKMEDVEVGMIVRPKKSSPYLYTKGKNTRLRVLGFAGRDIRAKMLTPDKSAEEDMTGVVFTVEPKYFKQEKK